MKVKVSKFFSNIQLKFRHSKFLAFLPIRCLLYIIHMHRRGKRLPRRGSSIKNESESWGKLLECTERGEACKTDKQTNKQKNNKQTNKQQTNTQTNNKQTHKQQTNKQTNKQQTNTQTNNKQTNKQTNKQQTNKQTNNKQTNTQTTNTQTGLKPLGSLTFFCFNAENIVINKTICHKK